ncbi:Os10g0205801 [Oryza sativa Japonica Group]|uniref:Os10g0205801 protein n=1 Tax=Oryza sativa subsp. japonica TaxID=39947 RepID=C7J7R8_ORYSJ|nr:Os10g0205801 [Oryza sativa Japonica Group]|eukprot:NP_001176065.1 Os10g0205801 [Oryza sativa Japonica Group]
MDGSCGGEIKRADGRQRSIRDGWTPLHLAIQSRNRDITMILLVNGADETRRNKMPAFSNYAIIVAI